jgi:hypothetical protein
VLEAMASVNVLTIRKWEHHMIQWIGAYRDRKGTSNTSKRSSAVAKFEMLHVSLIRYTIYSND